MSASIGRASYEAARQAKKTDVSLSLPVAVRLSLPVAVRPPVLSGDSADSESESTNSSSVPAGGNRKKRRDKNLSGASGTVRTDKNSMSEWRDAFVPTPTITFLLGDPTVGTLPELRQRLRALQSPPFASSTESVLDSEATRARNRKRAKGKSKASTPILEVKLQAKSRITSAEISSLLIHPSLEEDLVIVGDRAGNIGFWFPSTSGDDGEVFHEQSMKPIKNKWSWLLHKKNAYQEILREEEMKKEQRKLNDQLKGPEDEGSHGQYMEAEGRVGVPISCLRFRPGSDCKMLYSSSWNGAIIETNLDSLRSQLVVLLEIPCAFGTLAGATYRINSFDFSPDGKDLWIVDQQGGITFVDIDSAIEGSSEPRPTHQRRSPRPWERYPTGDRPIVTISISGDRALTSQPNPYPTKSSNAESVNGGDTILWDLLRLQLLSSKDIVEIDECRLADSGPSSWHQGALSAFFDTTGTRILQTVHLQNEAGRAQQQLRLFNLNLDSAQIPSLDLKWESHFRIPNLGFILDHEFVPPFLGKFANLPSKELAYIIGDACGGFEVGCFNVDEREIALEEDEYNNSTVESHPTACRYYVGSSGEPANEPVIGCEMQGYVMFYTAVL